MENDLQSSIVRRQMDIQASNPFAPYQNTKAPWKVICLGVPRSRELKTPS